MHVCTMWCSCFVFVFASVGVSVCLFCQITDLLRYGQFLKRAGMLIGKLYIAVHMYVCMCAF